MSLPPVVVEYLTGKKSLTFIATVIVLFGNRILAHLAPGFELDPVEVQLFVGSAAAYMIGQGVADHGKAAATKQVQGQAVSMMANGPVRDAAIHSLAGIAPDNATNADQIKTDAGTP